MKKTLRIILVLMVILTYALGKIHKIQRQSNAVSRALNNKQVNTKVADITTENNIKKISDKKSMVIEIKSTEE